MGPVIRFRDQQVVNFRRFAFPDPAEHGYRWVDVKCFELTAAPPTDRAVLEALITEDRFADDYAGGGIGTDAAIHGPYQLDHITAEAYEGLDTQSAVGVLTSWARQYGSVPADLADALSERVYALIASASSCYKLRDLDKAARHDWAGVHTQFHELVAINRVAGTVALIVAADD